MQPPPGSVNGKGKAAWTLTRFLVTLGLSAVVVCFSIATSRPVGPSLSHAMPWRQLSVVEHGESGDDISTLAAIQGIASTEGEAVDGERATPQNRKKARRIEAEVQGVPQQPRSPAGHNKQEESIVQNTRRVRGRRALSDSDNAGATTSPSAPVQNR